MYQGINTILNTIKNPLIVKHVILTEARDFHSAVVEHLTHQSNQKRWTKWAAREWNCLKAAENVQGGLAWKAKPDSAEQGCKCIESSPVFCGILFSKSFANSQMAQTQTQKN